MVVVEAEEELGPLLSDRQKQLDTRMLTNPPMVEETQIPLPTIALLRDILGRTISLAKMCTMLQPRPHMHQRMACHTLKALLRFLNNTTPFLARAWVFLHFEVGLPMVARPAMVLTIILMLLHLRIPNNLESETARIL